MKFFKLTKLYVISMVLLSLLGMFLSFRTNTMTKSKTNTKTNSEAKMSIFSYDFLTVMKRKMLLKQRNLEYVPNPAEEEEKPKHVKPKLNTGEKSDASKEKEKKDGTPSRSQYEGWIKYFKYNDGDTHNKKPNSFFKNNEYYEQMKNYPDFDLSSRSADGNDNFVPDEAYWWVTLFNDNIVISGSRKRGTTKVFENFNLNQVLPVVEGNGYKGGILDFGAFSEGACFKLVTQTHMTWIFCSESQEEKDSFMQAVKNAKLQIQRAKGEIVLKNEKPRQESLDTVVNQNNSNNIESLSQPDDGKPSDGYWIVLQTWSQCSKKCDSGVSTLHRLCIPPKKGGKPCEGQAVQTKPCNTKPCPNVGGQESTDGSVPGHKRNATEVKIQEASKPVTLKPIFKTMPFSSKPIRYHKCIIKEGDLLLLKASQDSDTPGISQIPIRAILNNRTISFYENAEDFSTHYTSYNLKSSDFSRSRRDRACFIISENKRNSELCPIGQDHTFKSYNEWDKDFHLFKFNCETKPDEVEAELNNKMKEKMDDAKREILTEREEIIKKKIHQKEEDAGYSILKKTSQVAQQALIKEENLEEMIEKEEEERESREEVMINQQIESEKKKNDCIQKAIKEREIENQYQMKNNETQKEVEDIKQDAMKEVLEKRNKLKQKIADMRKKAQRKSQALKSKLINMRLSMAQEMTDVYKDGDQGKCAQAMKDEQSRLNYCTASFSDVIKFSQCKDNEDFCSLCCENEFGEMHMDKRNACIKTLCEPEQAKAASDGKWIWSVNMKKK